MPSTKIKRMKKTKVSWDEKKIEKNYKEYPSNKCKMQFYNSSLNTSIISK